MPLGVPSPARIQVRVCPLDDALGLHIAELSGPEVGALRRLYRGLRTIGDRVDLGLRCGDGPRGLVDLLAEGWLDCLRDDLGLLEHGAPGSVVSPGRARAATELRASGLGALLVLLERVQQGRVPASALARIPALVRDQRAIMRTIIGDLDPMGVEDDRRDEVYSSAQWGDKWSTITDRLAGAASVRLSCDFDGVIASCRAEATLLDRITIGLIEHAAGQAVDGRIRLGLRPFEGDRDDARTLVRITVLCRIDQAHRAALWQQFGENIGEIFHHESSPSGPGRDLRAWGELVVRGLGLASVPHALEHGVLGARLIDQWLATWFHWPAARRTASASAGGAAASV